MEDYLQKLIEQEIDYRIKYDKVDISDKEREYAINSAHLYLSDVVHDAVMDAICGAQEQEHV